MMPLRRFGHILRKVCITAGTAAALTAFALSPAGAVPFFKGYGIDGMQPGEHGVGAFYQHQKSSQGANSVDMTGQVNPPDPFNSDPWPNPLAPGYNQTWDHDGNAATPEVSRNWWEGTATAMAGGGDFGGGWCGTTAWINSFYFFDQNGFSGLFDHSNLDPIVGPPHHGGRNWLERFTYANEDLALRAGGGAAGGCAAFPRDPGDAPGTLIPDYLADYGYSGRFVYDEYFWDAGTSSVMRRTAGGPVASGFASMLDLYRKELLRSEDVLVIMEGTSKDWWWSGSFHVVTGAGVETDLTKNILWFADPDKGKGGSGWGNSYLATDPVPEGTADYTMATLAADGRTFLTGPYAGAAITEFRTLSPIPEPPTLFLMAAGLIVLTRFRRRKT